MKIASGIATWRTVRFEGSEASQRYPVPARSAASPAMIAAPAIPLVPVRARSRPEVPLYAVRGRVGRRRLAHPGVISSALGSSLLGGSPISMAMTRPQYSLAGCKRSPLFGAPKVIVRSALTAGPATAPVVGRASCRERGQDEGGDG